MSYRLARTAEDQIKTVLLKSAKAFGTDAADRYGLLIITAMEAISADPKLPGSVAIDRVPGVRVYPIRLMRLRIEPARRVGTPRHLLVYRTGAEEVTDILGLIHDRMVLSRVARRLARITDAEAPRE